MQSCSRQFGKHGLDNFWLLPASVALTQAPLGERRCLGPSMASAGFLNHFRKDWTRAFGGAITGERRREAKCRCWRPRRLEARLSTVNMEAAV